MKLDFSIAERLMNDLAVICCAANNRVPETAEDLEAVENYARAKFIEIMNEWEEEMDEKWEIEIDEEEPAEITNPNYTRADTELCKIVGLESDGLDTEKMAELHQMLNIYHSVKDILNRFKEV